MSLISVILPVYNAAKYLREAVQSILDQTYDDFELLIYNDGSSDSSDQIIRSFDDRRIKYVHFSENKGYLNLLNQGLKEAKGDFIARMDGDDIALPDRFAEQVSFLEKNPSVGICGSWVEFIGSGNGVEKRPVSYEEVQYALFFGCPLTHPSVMMRAEMIRDHQLEYKEEFYYAEDHDFFATAARLFPVVNIPKVLLKYRLHSEQIGSAKWMEQYHKKCLIQVKMFSLLLTVDQQNDYQWLYDFLTEQSRPGNEWEREVDFYSERVLDANDTLGIYPKTIFTKAVRALFIEKKRKSIINYYYQEYYRNKHPRVNLLFRFIREPYNPLSFLGVKHSVYFLLKCLIGYKAK